jgi:REP element-mobilizing transposase RayT
MDTLPRRRHLTHTEIAGGTCHVTWRLRREQAFLSAGERTIIWDVLRRATGFGCAWRAAVVMDDHVHTLFSPGERTTSAQFVHAWKSASSHFIVKRCNRAAPIWQAEYYQRWISSPALIPICVEYIRNNPRRKWPGIENYSWLLP